MQTRLPALFFLGASLITLTSTQCTNPAIQPSGKFGLGFSLPPDPPAAIARVKAESDSRSSAIAKNLLARIREAEGNSSAPAGGANGSLFGSGDNGLSASLKRELEFLEPVAAEKLKAQLESTPPQANDGASAFGGLAPPAGGFRDWWVSLIGKKRSTELTAGSEKGWRNIMTGTNRGGQGGCGSCWAFSIVRVIESNYYHKYGKKLDLAEEDLVTAPFRSPINGHAACCCGGEWFDKPLKWIKTNGLADERSIPYKLQTLEMGSGKCHDNPECVFRPNANRIKNIVLNWKTFGTQPSDAELKRALLDYGPLAVAFAVPEGIFTNNGGIIKKDTPPLLDQNGHEQLHAVVLVGWDDSKGAWLFLNSWSPWGKNGYGWMEFGGHRFGMSATAVVVGDGQL